MDHFAPKADIYDDISIFTTIFLHVAVKTRDNVYQYPGVAVYLI